jgi:alpha-tubulin suppressor-like RCC1 family protein
MLLLRALRTPFACLKQASSFLLAEETRDNSDWEMEAVSTHDIPPSSFPSTTTGRFMPCLIELPVCEEGAGSVFQQVACGSNHTLSVDNKGCLFTWGCGSHGKLGHGDMDARYVPTRVVALAGARAEFYLLQLLVAATCAAVTNHCTGVLVTLAAGGTHHSAAVTDGGLVYTWGCASSGNWSFISLGTSRFKKGFLPNTSKKIVTGQLGHHTPSVTPEDDLQKVAACMPSPQVVRMFKGEQKTPSSITASNHPNH